MSVYWNNNKSVNNLQESSFFNDFSKITNSLLLKAALMFIGGVTVFFLEITNKS